MGLAAMRFMRSTILLMLLLVMVWAVVLLLLPWVVVGCSCVAFCGCRGSVAGVGNAAVAVDGLYGFCQSTV